MNPLVIIILLGLIILLTHFLEGITGFGCTVIAMPFAILLVGIDTAKPVLTVMGLLLTLYVVIISYQHIVWKQYFIILTYMLLGMPLGIFAFHNLPRDILIMILAFFMMFVSIKGLVTIYRPKKTPKEMNPYILRIILFLAGCVHGAFTSGGPLLIIYAIKKLPNKNEFRATLCLIWVTLNTIIIGENIINGYFTPEVTKTTLFMLPFLAVGAILGNWAHHKIEDKFFSQMVYGVLFISAVFMLI